MRILSVKSDTSRARTLGTSTSTAFLRTTCRGVLVRTDWIGCSTGQEIATTADFVQTARAHCGRDRNYLIHRTLLQIPPAGSELVNSRSLERSILPTRETGSSSCCHTAAYRLGQTLWTCPILQHRTFFPGPISLSPRIFRNFHSAVVPCDSAIASDVCVCLGEATRECRHAR